MMTTGTTPQHSKPTPVVVHGVLHDLESQGAQALVNGFAFASALAWLDVARYVVASVVKVPKTSGSYYLLSATLTTLVSVLVFMIVSMVIKVKQQQTQMAFAA